MPLPTVLGNTPSLSQITCCTVGHAVAGDKLTTAFANANADYFDGTYVGDKNRQSNFIKYGMPSVDISAADLCWAYNSTSTQCFTVSTNKTRWYISPISSYSHYCATVWDGDAQITNGVYPSGAVVKMTPCSCNTGSGCIYGYFTIGTLTGTAIEGATVTAIHNYNGGSTPPTVYVNTDSTFSLSYSNGSISTGSNSLYLIYTPTGYAGSRYTIYWYVTRSGSQKGTATVTNNNNGTQKTTYITLNEYAPAGAVYNVVGYTSLA